MKKLRRILFYLLLAVIVVFMAVVASAYLYRDKIINEFISRANEHLNTPVKIGKLDVTAFDQFPWLTIVCHNVSIEDSHKGIYPLFTAKEVRFQLNPIQVWRGDYSIRGVRILSSETNLKLDDQGRNNFTILKKGEKGAGGNARFELRNVDLHDTRVHYLDLRQRQDLVFTSQALVASISTLNDIYTIEADGDVTTEKLEVRGKSFLQGKSFDVSSNLVYDDLNKLLKINRSELKLRHSHFVVSGDYAWKDKNLIDIRTEGKNTDIQTLFSLAPETVAKRFEKYESRGDVHFSAVLKGEITPNTYPSLTVDFGFTHATLFHPEYESRIEDAGITGSYTTSNLLDPERGTLTLKNLHGVLNDKTFNADLRLVNFNDPDITFHFKGELDAPSVMNFYPIPAVQNATGSLFADISFEGRASLLKSKNTAQQVKTRGVIELRGITLDYGDQPIPLHDLKGNLQFTNNDLAISNVSGRLGNSDFLLNGFFKNVITFLFFENQPVGIEADLRSTFVDLDQLFAFTFGNESSTSGDLYEFSISPNINLNFNCDIGALRYKRFHGKRIKGDLLVKSQMAVSRTLALETMGGKLELSGIVDGKNPKAIDVVTTARLDNIFVDSVFYVFENFNQTFIRDKHLSGQGSADVSMELVLDETLRLFPKTLVADIGITIRNGELNNFEPMQKLSRYLGGEDLSRLRFAELRNDIHIENETVYLPQMRVRSNVTDIDISGTHRFDQRIEYRVATPLLRRKIDDPEALLAVEDDPRTGPRLFLKITGTTDDYKVQYDTEAVRKKIASDLKKEVQELKDAFKSKGKQKEKELELSKDDYFDWD